MEITTINFYSDNGWENCTAFNHTPSSQLHIPRIGDHVKNRYGDMHKVINVIWNVFNNSVDIYCEKIS